MLMRPVGYHHTEESKKQGLDNLLLTFRLKRYSAVLRKRMDEEKEAAA